jgi:hypothetical protein
VTPRFSWKYGWLDTLFGPAVAKRAQIFLPQIGLTVARWWDKAMFSLESKGRSHARS